ncbi:MAG: hypothetical protein ACAH59_06925 [Pseudobdellovibrionaceae bacterium]
MKKTLLISILLASANLWAWGGRGHHSICDAAVFLVKEKGLKEFLQNKPQIMGHLCNIPDTHWRNLGAEASQQGSAAHYVDLDIFGIPASEIPLDYKKIIETYTGQKNSLTGSVIRSIPLDFGSNWWRADQFFRRAVGIGPKWKESAAPANRQEEQDSSLPYNKAAFDFYVNLGLMGHFVGDNSQPLHQTADYDGYMSGHGGLHGFYEDTIVSYFDGDLVAKIIEKGKKMQAQAISKKKSDLEQVPFLTEKTVLAKMKALGIISFNEIKKVYALDKVKKPSVQKNEKGMNLKTPAEREDPEKAAKALSPMILTQLARSASLLAQLWDEAYIEVGRPKLASYKSYQYPFTPDFVPPDYFDLKILEKKETSN